MRKLPLVALSLVVLSLTACSTEASGGDNGLACRNYERATVKNSTTIVNWTNQLATDADVADAFASLANASSDNASFVAGNALTVFSAASTAWRAARVAVVAGSNYSSAVKAAVNADSAVRDFCSSIGEAIP
jgi:hypothetical protein